MPSVSPDEAQQIHLVWMLCVKSDFVKLIVLLNIIITNDCNICTVLCVL